MKKIIARRLISLVLLLLGISFIVFFSIHLAPGDPAVMIAGPTATAEEVKNIQIDLGLDKPIFRQYVKYLNNVVQGDLGLSYQTKQPVMEMLLMRLPITLKLALASIIVAIIFGLTTGIIAAIKHNTFFDHTMTITALLGISTPSFWLGTILILFFSVRLQLLPVGGLTEPFYTTMGLKQLILPAITLSASSAAIISRITRTAMLEVGQADYIRTARAKGVKERQVIFVHSLKNALIPVITVIGMNFGLLLGGAIITEQVFAINGIGRLIIEAISARDFPVVQGAVLVIATFFVIINLLVDIIYMFVDPRISYD